MSDTSGVRSGNGGMTLGIALVGGMSGGAAVGGCLGGVGAIPGAAIGAVTAGAVWGLYAAKDIVSGWLSK